MGKDGNGSLSVRGDNAEEERKCTGRVRDDSGSKSESEKDRKPSKTKRKAVENSDLDSESGSDSGKERKRCRRSEKGRRKSHRKSRKRRGSEDEDSESESDYSSQSESEYSDSEGSKSESESEEERRRRKRKQRKKGREREEERDRKRRRKEKEKKRRRREKEEEREKKRKEKRKKKKEKLERGKRGAVTNSWGKYGIIRETDMWNKRPEFTAWLAEVKQVNLESLPTWEEKQMFKEFMEDHNTATFPSKKYYNLDAYFKRQMEKEQKKGFKKVLQTERTVFNDEEQRRLELQQAREKQKEEQVEALKRSMQGGMAQAMREQAQLKEEMVYQYKLGNFEAAAAIQRRLDPDVAM